MQPQEQTGESNLAGRIHQDVEALFSFNSSILPSRRHDDDDDDDIASSGQDLGTPDTSVDSDAGDSVLQLVDQTPYKTLIISDPEAQTRLLKNKALLLFKNDEKPRNVENELLRESAERFRPPLAKKKIKAIVTEARVAYLLHPATRRKEPGLLSAVELQRLSAQSTGAKWTLQGIIEKGSLVLLAGDSGLGKSPLLYQLALAVAEGLPFLGLPTEKGTVIYLDYENGQNQIDRLIDALGNHMALQKRSPNVLIWHTGMPKPNLKALIETHKPTLIIIDSLRMHDPDAVKENDKAAKLIGSLKELSDPAGVTIVLVHHLRKPPNEGAPGIEEVPVLEWLNQASGARGLVNHSDTRIGISLPGSKHRVGDASSEIALVMRGFTRLEGEFGPLFIAREYNADGDPAGYSLASNIELLANDVQKRALLSLGDEFTFTQAKQAYGRSDHPTSEFLKKCVAFGLVNKDEDGKGYRKRKIQ